MGKCGLPALLLLFLWLSGCSRNAEQSANTETATASELMTPLPESDSEDQGIVVEIKGMQYVPATININKGDRITWVNNDIVIHDVAEKSNDLWKSPPLNPGEKWSKVFTESTDYYCSIHKVMNGKIEIKQ